MFKDNNNLEAVIIDTDTFSTGGIYPFIGCTNLYAIYVPDSIHLAIIKSFSIYKPL